MRIETLHAPHGQSPDFVQRVIDAGSKHSRAELEEAWRKMRDGAIEYLARESQVHNEREGSR